MSERPDVAGSDTLTGASVPDGDTMQGRTNAACFRGIYLLSGQRSDR